MNILSTISVSLFLLLVSWYPMTVSADTHITDPDALQYGAVWNATGSPYIVETDLYMPAGHALLVESGVSVISGTTTSPEKKYLTLNGDLVVRGTEEVPVSFTNFEQIFVGNATATIDHGSFIDIREGVSLLRSHAGITHSVFNESLFEIRGSTVLVASSTFIGEHSTAISSLLVAPPIFQVMNTQGTDVNNGEYGIGDVGSIGGIGNALDVIDPAENQLTITGSIFSTSTQYLLYNETANTIDARNNWWGSATGPDMSVIHGAIVTSPWLVQDPRIKSTPPTCCSNILFLPGIEASRLYRDTRGMFSTSTNQLWIPNRNGDVRKLFMSDTGTSLESGIYTKDVLDKGLGYRIYDSFISSMNDLVAKGTIRTWTPFAYDWRKGVDQIVLEPIQYPTSTRSLQEEFLRLASSSATGKVTIVAHSNGGLVAKMLGKSLEQIGKKDLIDRVLFVAVPQLGTPQAIAGLLHGDAQELGGGWILSQGVARSLGLNMPSAYGLLPSARFFRSSTEPVIKFDSSTVTDEGMLARFLTGATYKRSQPKESDTQSALVLSSLLLDWANRIHTAIDMWRFSSSTKVTSIVGWRIPTTKTVEYTGSSVAKSMTLFGDGTVLASSASGYDAPENSSTSIVYFDQTSAKKDPYSHADILESESVKELITSLVSTSSGDSRIGNLLPQGMSYRLPEVLTDSWLKVGIHSPVAIDVYSDTGGHIGIVPNPDPTSDFYRIDNTIDGAQYHSFGDEKYVLLPVEATTSYSVRLQGTGIGTFSMSLEQSIGDQQITERVYTDLPVTPLLLASTTVGSLVDLEHAKLISSSTAPGGVILDLASTTPPILALDIDGDGTTDIFTKPTATTDPLIHLAAIKKIIESLKLKKSVEKEWLKRIDTIKNLIQKGKTEKAHARILEIMKKLQVRGAEPKHWHKRGLKDENRQELLSALELFVAELERVW